MFDKKYIEDLYEEYMNSKNSDGFDRLKEYEVDALLFFSDGFGSFPAEEPDFKTIFCIPKEYKNHAFYEEAKLPGFVEKIYIE